MLFAAPRFCGLRGSRAPRIVCVCKVKVCFWYVQIFVDYLIFVNIKYSNVL